MPHSFLSSVDFDGSGQLVFRYTACTITIYGRGLCAIWDALSAGNLGRLIECPSQDQSDGRTSIASIAIQDVNEMGEIQGFPFEASAKG